METFILALLIFVCRVVDVTLGTLRTIATVQGRSLAAFVFGFGEVSIWLGVIAAVVPRVAETPFLGLFYALGYASGNVVGIRMERRLAAGYEIVRVISIKHGQKMAVYLRSRGFALTSFFGEGLSGPVQELVIVCRRKDLMGLLSFVQSSDPEAFVLTEHAGSVNRVCQPANRLDSPIKGMAI